MARAIQRSMGATFGLGIAAFPSAGTAVPTAAAAPSIDMTGTLHVALAAGDNVRVKIVSDCESPRNHENSFG